MRLLIFTQKVNKNDSVLGFFHTWITEIAKRTESVTVICLGKGDFDLPKNVMVYSLGKEAGISKLSLLRNLYKYLFLVRGSYDKVFVHMNQEYVLFAGLYWKLKNIPVYMWRNHPRGNILTRMAVSLSTKIFCTSKASFSARFKKTVIMPAGIDTNIFKPSEEVIRKKYSVCMVGRISPIKHVQLALEAINKLVSSGFQISLNIIGSPTNKDLQYYDSLKKYVAEHNLSNSISFSPAVTFDKLSEIYNSHEICLNLTESGSFDKTIVESAACGAIPLVSNISLKDLLPKECITGRTPETVSVSLQQLLQAHTQVEIQEKLKSFVKSQSLDTLLEKLFKEIQ